MTNEERILQELQTIQLKLDRVDRRVDEVVMARLARVEQRLDNHDLRFDSVQTKFEKTNVKLAATAAGVTIGLGVMQLFIAGVLG